MIGLDLLEQGNAASDKRCVAKLVPATVEVPESPDGAVNPSPGAAIVCGRGSPIAAAQSLGIGQQIAGEVGRGHADGATATIAEKPSPCWPLKLLPAAATTGMFMDVSWATNSVIFCAGPPSVAEKVLSIISPVRQRHVDGCEVIFRMIVDNPLQGIGDTGQAGCIGVVGDAQGDDVDTRRDARVFWIIGTNQSGDGRAVLRGRGDGVAGIDPAKS